MMNVWWSRWFLIIVSGAGHTYTGADAEPGDHPWYTRGQSLLIAQHTTAHNSLVSACSAHLTEIDPHLRLVSNTGHETPLPDDPLLRLRWWDNWMWWKDKDLLVILTLWLMTPLPLHSVMSVAWIRWSGDTQTQLCYSAQIFSDVMKTAWQRWCGSMMTNIFSVQWSVRARMVHIDLQTIDKYHFVEIDAFTFTWS